MTKQSAGRAKKRKPARVPLQGHQRQFLRGLAHPLSPVIHIGTKGLTPPLLAETSSALEHHELIKVKLGRHVPEDLATCAEKLERELGAEIVQRIGKVIVVFRQNEDPESQKIELPKRRREVVEGDAPESTGGEDVEAVEADDEDLDDEGDEGDLDDDLDDDLGDDLGDDLDGDLDDDLGDDLDDDLGDDEDLDDEDLDPDDGEDDLDTDGDEDE